MESKELDDFRLSWINEIQGRKGNVPQHIEGLASTHVEAALLYAKAEQHERNGEVNKAIPLYRQAFKLAPDLSEREVEEVSRRIAATTMIDPPHDPTAHLSFSSLNIHSDFHHLGAATQSLQSTTAVTSATRSRVAAPVEEVTPTQEGDRPCVTRPHPIHIEKASFATAGSFIGDLAPELLQKIFSLLDPVSLDTCGRVCVQFHMLSREGHLWQRLCEQLWGQDVASSERVKFGMSWRLLFISTPHLHFDGMYISRGSYIRSGACEWGGGYDPVLVCRFFRYVRFYPDGSVQSVTSTTEPNSFVPRHKRTLANANSCRTGRYKLQDSHLTVVVLEPESRSSFCYRLRISKASAKGKQCLKWESLSVAQVRPGEEFFVFDEWTETGAERPAEVSLSSNSDRPFFFVRT
eukprot:c11505_g1_i1.p1 GENE.c11505_g1_i1~~c11505_g1_i1.p1  ORF type:complete len:407 (+),score=80.05 c11505_g1_i1:873-2093(+)